MNESLLEISKRLYDAIEESGLSYGDIANKTGLPKSAIHRYATGETTKIPLDRLQIIGRAIGVDPAWLMGWSQQKTDPQSGIKSFNQNISDDALEIAIAYESLDEIDRGYVWGTIDMLRQKDKYKEKENSAS